MNKKLQISIERENSRLCLTPHKNKSLIMERVETHEILKG
jgi:hypothetical protein